MKAGYRWYNDSERDPCLESGSWAGRQQIRVQGGRKGCTAVLCSQCSQRVSGGYDREVMCLDVGLRGERPVLEAK